MLSALTPSGAASGFRSLALAEVCGFKAEILNNRCVVGGKNLAAFVLSADVQRPSNVAHALLTNRNDDLAVVAGVSGVHFVSPSFVELM